MKKQILPLFTLVALALPAAAQTTNNEYFIYDGTTEYYLRAFGTREDGLYMVFRPELIRGLKKVDGWTFVVQDQNPSTPESLILEIRKDDGKGLPGVNTADVVWSGRLNNFSIGTGTTPQAGAFYITGFQGVSLPSINDAYWMGLRFPLTATNTDGLWGHGSGPATASNADCVEVPRGEGNFKGQICAYIDFNPTALAANHWDNVALVNLVSFAEPVLQGFASNYGYSAVGGALNFCVPGSNPRAAAPKAQPENNYGYAGIWPDVNDVRAQGRYDNFGWRVTVNQLAQNGGFAFLLFSDMTADPAWFQLGFGTLYLFPASRWFTLVQLAAPLTTQTTTPPYTAEAVFGPLDLGPGPNLTRALFAQAVGPLHTQAVVVDGKNINNITFSNMTTMSFDWLGAQEVVLDATTTSQKFNVPTNARQAYIHSLRGKLTVQAELGGNPFGPQVPIQDGCTKPVLAVPAGGAVNVALDSTVAGNAGAKFLIQFIF